MRISSIKFKLKIMMFFSIFSLLTIGGTSIYSMNKSANSVEKLYVVNMKNNNNSSSILEFIGVARTSLLLSFQHAPDSEFSSLHDHPTSSHLNSVLQSLDQINILVKNLASSDLNLEQVEMIEEFTNEFNELKKQGFEVAVNQVQKGNYYAANELLIKYIKPKVKNITQTAKSLSLQILSNSKGVYNNTGQHILSSIYIIIICIIVGVVMICGLSGLIMNRINISLTQIRNTTCNVTKGDLTQRVLLIGDDEFTEISSNINQVVDAFQHIIKNINDNSIRLGTTAEESSVVTSQTKQNVINQQDQIQLVATAMHEFTCTVQEVANSAILAAESSIMAGKSATKGKVVVQDTISMISELNKGMVETSELITALSTQIDKIGSVLEVIGSISARTNQLALNVAIEAARAGNTGRGFSVVADEVRSLVNRTHESTEIIKVMITELHIFSNNSMANIGSSSNLAKKTAVMAKQAGIALDKINENVELINSMNIQIATAAEEQTAVTQEIDINININIDIDIDIDRINDISKR
ncbi:methyl-accepting chemotaxis protein [Shewanella sp. D64]|uniref:methyl-accepting chemotaxis protein n=1 Tax=unclassified Shewanella TaxID=196818 RepID=UPI0022BA41E5|nr:MULTISPECIES: methyl-accepting chemotaxis protein [unclassified Shewanella]MEC4724379.1 methyl-accepting chemotaxis protein [Shewanella sp. D64]MEC4738891.1 methyl-accepting chemotaxis protein [Shewanella sp. E94]WBJ97672.1 methyl-accepting chemotaxis protein [Shewanella sp. MTB7]